jgi:hypothetical protein
MPRPRSHDAGVHRSILTQRVVAAHDMAIEFEHAVRREAIGPTYPCLSGSNGRAWRSMPRRKADTHTNFSAAIKQLPPEGQLRALSEVHCSIAAISARRATGSTDFPIRLLATAAPYFSIRVFVERDSLAIILKVLDLSGIFTSILLYARPLEISFALWPPPSGWRGVVHDVTCSRVTRVGEDLRGFHYPGRY